MPKRKSRSTKKRSFKRSRVKNVLSRSLKAPRFRSRVRRSRSSKTSRIGGRTAGALGLYSSAVGVQSSHGRRARPLSKRFVVNVERASRLPMEYLNQHTSVMAAATGKKSTGFFTHGSLGSLTSLFKTAADSVGATFEDLKTLAAHVHLSRSTQELTITNGTTAPCTVRISEVFPRYDQATLPESILAHYQTGFATDSQTSGSTLINAESLSSTLFMSSDFVQLFSIKKQRTLQILPGQNFVYRAVFDKLRSVSSLRIRANNHQYFRGLTSFLCIETWGGNVAATLMVPEPTTSTVTLGITVKNHYYFTTPSTQKRYVQYSDTAPVIPVEAQCQGVNAQSGHVEWVKSMFQGNPKLTEEDDNPDTDITVIPGNPGEPIYPPDPPAPIFEA